MGKRLLLAVVFLACGFALRAEGTVYEIDLVPSGRLVARDAPVLKGSVYIFRHAPDGRLMSVRDSDVKKISEQERAPRWTEGVTEIGNLAMDGPRNQAGLGDSLPAGAAKRNPGFGQGFNDNVVPGATEARPNSASDYQVGRTVAAPPASAVQSSAGAVPR